MPEQTTQTRLPETTPAENPSEASTQNSAWTDEMERWAFASSTCGGLSEWHDHESC